MRTGKQRKNIEEISNGKIKERGREERERERGSKQSFWNHRNLFGSQRSISEANALSIKQASCLKSVLWKRSLCMQN